MNNQDLVLVKLDAAKQALAEAKTIQDTKRILDISAAAQTWARRQHLSEEAQDYARQIKIRAEIKLGELLRDPSTEKATGGLPYQSTGSIPDPVETVPTYADLGISKRQANDARKLAALPLDAQEAVVEGAVTVTEALRNVRRAENQRKRDAAAPPPTGRYETIVIDPPWQMEKIERDSAPNQVAFDYPTMTEEELEKFSVADFAADAAHLFCWTTHKHLPSALRLVEAWGFKYVCLFVWHKSGGFQPFGLPQYNCEFVIYARRGSPYFVETKAFNCAFTGIRREHSRKPDEFYDVIRRVTKGPRIDVFSREEREGFATWGNETGKFAA